MTTSRTVLRGAPAVAALVLLGACAVAPTAAPDTPPRDAVASSAPGAGSPPGATSVGVVLPPVGTGLDYQLGEPYALPEGVGVVVRDARAAPAPGVYSVCYVNAFQSQPDETDAWLSERPEAVLRAADGTPVVDPDWPDEVLLDTSRPQTRQVVHDAVVEVVDLCADAGFDAVELDNLDSFTRSGGALSMDDNLALAGSLVDHAHSRGLAVAQKNTVELGERGREVGFDLAVVEECEAYDECEAYRDVYGTYVLEIEYSDSPGFDGLMEAACAARGDEVPVVGRDRDLTAPGDPDYVFRSC